MFLEIGRLRERQARASYAMDASTAVVAVSLIRAGGRPASEGCVHSLQTALEQDRLSRCPEPGAPDEVLVEVRALWIIGVS